jgi:adenosylmethionine-8-amino-7-oxononanoate aminotransferase
MASAEYLRGVQEICNEHGILLIADEVCFHCDYTIYLPQ